MDYIVMFKKAGIEFMFHDCTLMVDGSLTYKSFTILSDRHDRRYKPITWLRNGRERFGNDDCKVIKVP